MDKEKTGTKPTAIPLAQRLKKMLGLPETATDDEISEALEKALTALPDPEKYVPIEAMESAMKDRADQASAQAESRAQSKVQDALARGHITPAMKEWATALCTQNEASFDAFIAKSAAPFGHLVSGSHTSTMPPSATTALAVERQGDAAAVCRQLGLSADALDNAIRQ